MSIAWLSAAWDRADLDGGALLVFLALCDVASDTGEAWPSVATLARRARLEIRQTRNILKTLEAGGMIERIGVHRYPGQTGSPCVKYRLHIKPAKNTPFADKGAIGDHLDDQTSVQSATDKGAINDAQACNPQHLSVQSATDKGAMESAQVCNFPPSSVQPSAHNPRETLLESRQQASNARASARDPRLETIEAGGGWLTFKNQNLESEWLAAVDGCDLDEIAAVLRDGLGDGNRIHLPSSFAASLANRRAIAAAAARAEKSDADRAARAAAKVAQLAQEAKIAAAHAERLAQDRSRVEAALAALTGDDLTTAPPAAREHLDALRAAWPQAALTNRLRQAIAAWPALADRLRDHAACATAAGVA